MQQRRRDGGGPCALRRAIFCVCLVFLAASPTHTRSQTRIDLNLVLAIDCSQSVDDAEFALQIQGTARALRSEEILQAIHAEPFGSVAVTVVQWSGENSQIVAIPWTLVSDRESAATLADDVANLPRLTRDGSTSISALIGFAADLIARSPNRATRNVIDVAADGANNSGTRVDIARDHAVSRGIVVNGLTILNEVQYLHYYFRNHVIGGHGAFVEIASDYADFERAIAKKLLREIQGSFLF